jgi:hypothetical protein
MIFLVSAQAGVQQGQAQGACTSVNEPAIAGGSIEPGVERSGTPGKPIKSK